MLSKPQLQPIGKKNKLQIDFSGGLNMFSTPFALKDSESVECVGTSSRNYPAISPIYPVQYGYLETDAILGGDNADILYMADYSITHFDIFAYSISDSKHYWYRVKGSDKSKTLVWSGTLTTGVYTIVNMKTGSASYTIVSSYDHTLICDNSTMTVTNITATAPNSRLIVVNKGRVFYGKSNTIVFSTLNAPTDYTTTGVDGSGTIVIPINEIVEAVTIWQDNLLIFTANTLWMLTGSNPNDFQVTKLGNSGTKTPPAILRSAIYWLNNQGAYRWNGGEIEKISQKLNGLFEKYTTSGGYRAIAYLDKFVRFSAMSFTLEYDVDLGVWNIIKLGGWNYAKYFNCYDRIFATRQNPDTLNTFYLDVIYETGYTTNDTTRTWYWISKPFVDTMPSGDTSLANMWVVYYLPTGSTLKLYYKTSAKGTVWTEIMEFSASIDVINQRVNIPLTFLKNVDWYQLKFEGTGGCTIYYLEKELRSRVR